MGNRSILPPAVPARPPAGPAAAARRLADRLAAAVRPLRVLDAVRWDPAAEAAFHAGRPLPDVTADSYRRPLPFAPDATRAELAAIEAAVRNDLGTDHPAARLLLKAVREGRLTTRLIDARGTPDFAALSRELYGSSLDAPWFEELTDLLDGLVEALPDDESDARDIPAIDAAADLHARFTGYFGPGAGVRVFVSGDLSADAAAGDRYLKLRAGARFSRRDVRLLEVHEGWAHLATTLNGQRQPNLPVLARCTPAATRTQEGLAVFLELATGAAGRGRARKLLLRVRAVAMAEAGADFRDVYRHFRDAGGDPRESYRCAARVFRGSLPDGGPFTKDLTYGEGLLRVLTFARGELAGGGVGRLPYMMCGKAAVEDVPLLAELGRTGWLAPPRWVPPPFRDPAGLRARVESLEVRRYTAV